MGDCLFVTTVARQIKEVDFPGCHLSWLVGDKYKQVLVNNPYIDKIIPVPIKSPEGAREDIKNIVQNTYKEYGVFDKTIITEYVPENYDFFYGTIRSSFYRAYGKAITISPEPLIFLTQEEIKNVEAFAKKHELFENRWYPIIFEYTPQAFQSDFNEEKATKIAKKIIKENPHVKFIFSSHKPLTNHSSRMIDGSVLSWRENAELTKYCKLLVGCSSGITWINTSNAAAKIPMVQSICSEDKFFNGILTPSVELDFIRTGISTKSIIEFTDPSTEDLTYCLDLIIKKSFSEAKIKFFERKKCSSHIIDNYFMNKKLRLQGKSTIEIGKMIGKADSLNSDNFYNLKNYRKEIEHIIFTIVARNYISQAAALGDSIKKQNDDIVFIPFICDTYRWEGSSLFAKHPKLMKRFNWMFLDDLEYPNVMAMILRYSATEFCTSVKAAVFLDLIKKFGKIPICYFDPDIIVYSSLTELKRALKDSSFLLIPHITADPFDEGGITIQGVHYAGIYNLGFLGINPLFKETIPILAWWRDKLEFQCINCQPQLFVDQKWMDFIPCFAEHFKIFRHPGYNIAYWNLHERFLSEEQGIILVNEMPLKFFHFSGYNPTQALVLSKYQNFFVLSKMPIIKRLTDDYASRLYNEGYSDFSSLDYGNDYSPISRRKIPGSLRSEYLAMCRNIAHLKFNPFEDPWVIQRLDKNVAKNLYPNLDTKLYPRAQ
jgi:ADP-heptose:LPS heptosyltransferase